MPYKIINLPVTVRLQDPLHDEFRNLSKEDAKLYYAWFLEQIPHRLSILEEAVHESPAYRGWVADYSPESLNLLGQWFVSKVSKRPRQQAEIDEMYHRSPEWFKHVPIGNWDLSVETYSFCFDIGIYFAMVLQKNIQGLSWKLIAKQKKHMDLNQPVITGLKMPDLNPFHIMTILARQIAKKTKGGERLKELYDIWSRI